MDDGAGVDDAGPPFAREVDACGNEAVRQSASTLGRANEEAGNRPRTTVSSLRLDERSRCSTLAIPLPDVAAWTDLHPAHSPVAFERKHARRGSFGDPIVDHRPAAFSAMLFPLFRGKPEIHAPAAEAGTLLAEQILEGRPIPIRNGHDGQRHSSLPGRLPLLREYHTLPLVHGMFASMRDPVNNPAHGFCRDCLCEQPGAVRRCGACGSPRILRHPELYRLSLAHIDCDAFYAAVEKRDRPELRDKPLIVGGGKRGVVSTACYLARIRGVRSAMPMFKALEACPEAVVVKPDMEKYVRVGREIRSMMQALTPLVEPLSIDEAFLDLGGTERLHGQPAAMVLADFARRVERDIGVSVSVGLSYCKFLAKVASDLRKPRGFAVIGQAEAVGFLAEQPVTLIWGVGKSFAATLEADGLRTIGQLQQLERGDLMRRYGVMGDRLYRLSRGQDARQVHVDHEAKTVSAETTFDIDLADMSDLAPILRALSEKVSARLKRADIAGRTVVLKMKTRDFRIRTRNRALADPTRLADRIFQTGLQMMEKELDGTRFRLLGIGVSDLSDASRADPPDLVDLQARKRAMAEQAVDRVREKFGRTAVETGYTFGRGGRSVRDDAIEEDGDVAVPRPRS